MNYAYDLKVNFNEKLINFYEWNNNDKIENIRKTHVYYLDLNTYKDIYNEWIKVDASFLSLLRDTDYTCVFCSDIDALCIKFNKEGYAYKVSKLSIIDEREILDEFVKGSTLNLKYKKVNKRIKNNHYTREEESKIDKIINFIESGKDNKSLIEYLYNEWFDNKPSSNKYKNLIDSVKKEYTSKHDNILKIIDTISCSNE